MQSEIDSTSISSASPYIVQSPSRDSHDDKSSTNSHTTPAQSPSHPSHSRMSSESRVSGPYRFSMIGKPHHHHEHEFLNNNNNIIINNKNKKKKNKKGWPPLFSVIDEEDDEGYVTDDDYYDDRQVTRQCRVVMLIMGFVMLFITICFITWVVSRQYKLQVHMKNWKLNNFYHGEGSDNTGVPTKFLTINCSVKMGIHNPATFFGIHVSSTSLNLFYSKIMVGSGQFMNYYQPKKSGRTISVNVEGRKVPLYGVGEGLVTSNNNGSLLLKLVFEVRSQAYLVGPLVKTIHHRRILCIMKIDSQNNKVIEFNEDSCSYN